MSALSERRPRRWRWIVLGLALAILTIFAVPGSRRSLLRAAGYALAVPDPLIHSADVVVVAIDAQGAATLEAADLIHQGVSSRVAVFADPPTAADQEFIRRGLPYDDRAAISDTQLHMLGVQSVERIPRYTSGSEQEGRILPGWCRQHGYHSAILVTSTDHARRLARIMRRATRKQDLRIVVVPSRYSNFKPDQWWKTRYGARTEIIEMEKLLLDLVRHPLS